MKQETCARTLLLALLAGAAIATSFAGCGGSSEPGGEETIAVAGRSTPACDLGGVSPLKIARVGGVIVRKSPVRILACGRSPSYGVFYIVGYDTNNGTCVGVDAMSLRKTYGFICRQFGIPWIDFCTKSKIGCVLRYQSEDGSTLAFGTVSADFRAVKASVSDGAEIGGIALARVDAELQKLIHRREPVVFFAVSLPGCVPQREIRLEALETEHSSSGSAIQPDSVPLQCRANAS